MNHLHNLECTNIIESDGLVHVDTRENSQDRDALSWADNDDDDDESK